VPASFLVATGLALALNAFTVNASAQDLRVIGSGASFPFPIYSAWFKQFSKEVPGATVDYQAK
jgi:phosphate transport system substrate-binding protein